MSDSEDDGKIVRRRRRQDLRKPPQHTVSSGSADDLVSVTIKKLDPSQKAGIKLVQKQGGVYVSAVTEGGLFDDSEIGLDDRVLSINGKRLKKGESTELFMKVISSASDKVTIVVKKANMKATRGVRSMSPSQNIRRKKLVKKNGLRTSDGQLRTDINPELERFASATAEDDKEQYRIRVDKLFPRQGPGIAFKKIGTMLFVSGISLDSIFKDTQIALGDRIVSVNDTNFMSYAEECYADRLLRKKAEEVSLVVEKGWKTFNMEKDVDDFHNQPSRDPLVEDHSSSKDTASFQSGEERKKVQRMYSTSGKYTVEKKSKQKKKKKKKNRISSKASSTDTDGEHTVNDSSDISIDLAAVKISKKNSKSNNLRFLEHKGDYLCVTIKKKSEKHPGIRIKKVDSTFILKKVPSYEKRIPLGSRVLALNGSSNFKSEDEAKELIDGSKGNVVLIIDFEKPILQPCPRCRRG